MKNLVIIVFTFFFLGAQAQEIDLETFREHMIMVSENPEVLKKYKVEDLEGNRVFYVNVGNYNQFHQKESIPNQSGELFTWNEGSVFFYDIPYVLDLLRIGVPDEKQVYYEFVYTTQESKFFFELKFVKQGADWELLKPAITKLKKIKGD